MLLKLHCCLKRNDVYDLNDYFKVFDNGSSALMKKSYTLLCRVWYKTRDLCKKLSEYISVRAEADFQSSISFLAVL